MDAGLTGEQAKKELSRFYRRDSGSAAVCSGSFDDFGPMYVNLDYVPDDVSDGLGAFAASRAASRARPNNSGFRIVTKAEYKAFMKDREMVKAAKKLFSK
jgi:hypothetical protein